jgi:hypothetical protein
MHEIWRLTLSGRCATNSAYGQMPRLEISKEADAEHLLCGAQEPAEAASGVGGILALEDFDGGRLLVRHSIDVHNIVANQQFDAVELEVGTV